MWLGRVGSSRKRKQGSWILNSMLQLPKSQKFKGKTMVSFCILTPFSCHLFSHKFPLGCGILKYPLNQSVCSIHHTWPIVSNPVSSIIHAINYFSAPPVPQVSTDAGTCARFLPTLLFLTEFRDYLHSRWEFSPEKTERMKNSRLYDILNGSKPD